MDVTEHDDWRGHVTIYRDEDGLKHREDGPAEIIRTVEGRVIVEQYFRYGSLYREDGPAFLSWNKEGELVSREYWLNGHIYDKTKYYREITRRKIRKRK